MLCTLCCQLLCILVAIFSALLIAKNSALLLTDYNYTMDVPFSSVEKAWGMLC